jgi:COP9 signalosome complex subunit 4
MKARLFDFSVRFNEAAQAYHRLSYESLIHPDDRIKMLTAAVIASILAPAGPQRSRTLAALNQDDRMAMSLPAYLPTMLTKMLMERIVRTEEVREFEAGLEDHQRATVEGGGTLLERAVREHNVGACSKVSSYPRLCRHIVVNILSLDRNTLTHRYMITSRLTRLVQC